MRSRSIVSVFVIVAFIAVTGMLFCCDRTPENVIGTVAEEEVSGGALKQVETEEAQYGQSDVSAAVTSERCMSETEIHLIYVYVCGSVKKPDVYQLQADARVYEAIEAAGGALGDADLDQLNLADSLADGQKIYVPGIGEIVDVQDQNGDTTEKKLNINVATSEQLQSLPGIGAAKAEAIITYRETQGPFASVEDLLQVPGIKEGIFGQIQELIRVD